MPVDLHPGSPKEADEKESYGPGIWVYRFSVQYINGRTVEKVSAQLPEEYHRYYKGYVRKVTLIGKKVYTVREFKKTFGEKNRNLLIQGLFGKDDMDIVMENRIKRGLAPDQSVLPRHPRVRPVWQNNKKSSRESGLTFVFFGFAGFR